MRAVLIGIALLALTGLAASASGADLDTMTAVVLAAAVFGAAAVLIVVLWAGAGQERAARRSYSSAPTPANRTSGTSRTGADTPVQVRWYHENRVSALPAQLLPPSRRR